MIEHTDNPDSPDIKALSHVHANGECIKNRSGERCPNPERERISQAIEAMHAEVRFLDFDIDRLRAALRSI